MLIKTKKKPFNLSVWINFLLCFRKKSQFLVKIKFICEEKINFLKWLKFLKIQNAIASQ